MGRHTFAFNNVLTVEVTCPCLARYPRHASCSGTCLVPHKAVGGDGGGLSRNKANYDVILGLAGAGSDVILGLRAPADGVTSLHYIACPYLTPGSRWDTTSAIPSTPSSSSMVTPPPTPNGFTHESISTPVTKTINSIMLQSPTSIWKIQC